MLREPRALGTVVDRDKIWSLLPDTGEGWVETTSEIRRFSPTDRSGVLLNAEVADGPKTTIVRFSAGQWSSWTIEEGGNISARYVEEHFVSTAKRASAAIPTMTYRTYWRQVDDDGISVWKPFVSRFCSWED